MKNKEIENMVNDILKPIFGDEKESYGFITDEDLKKEDNKKDGKIDYSFLKRKRNKEEQNELEKWKNWWVEDKDITEKEIKKINDLDSFTRTKEFNDNFKKNINVIEKIINKEA